MTDELKYLSGFVKSRLALFENLAQQSKTTVTTNAQTLSRKTFTKSCDHLYVKREDSKIYDISKRTTATPTSNTVNLRKYFNSEPKKSSDDFFYRKLNKNTEQNRKSFVPLISFDKNDEKRISRKIFDDDPKLPLTPITPDTPKSLITLNFPEIKVEILPEFETTDESICVQNEFRRENVESIALIKNLISFVEPVKDNTNVETTIKAYVKNIKIDMEEKLKRDGHSTPGIGDVQHDFKKSESLKKVIEELLQNEEKYIKSLENGINNYLNFENLPPLMITRPEIFEVLVQIHNFHKEQLYEKLQENQENIFEFCNSFKTFLQSNQFYLYVRYGMQKSKFDLIYEKNLEFFEEQQRAKAECDEDGILSFVMLPIYRISKYRLFFDRIFKNIMKTIENIFVVVEVKNELEKLLGLVNDGIALGSMVFDKNVENFNIFEQGKLLKSGEFDIFMEKPKKMKYFGKVYLFEKAIIHTEFNSTKKNYKCHGIYHGRGTTVRPGKRNKKKVCLSFTDAEEEEYLVKLTPTEKNIDNWMEIVEKFLTNENKKKPFNEDDSDESNDDFDELEKESTKHLFNSRKFKEILSTEKDYITNLDIGIGHLYVYYDIVNEYLSSILKFHEERFYPALEKCCNNDDPELNLEIFMESFSWDDFRNYIYFIKDKRNLLNLLKDDFAQLVKDNERKTFNIFKFLEMPVERLNKYLIFMEDIIKECDLSVDNLATKVYIEAKPKIQDILKEFYKETSFDSSMFAKNICYRIRYDDALTIHKQLDTEKIKIYLFKEAIIYVDETEEINLRNQILCRGILTSKSIINTEEIFYNHFDTKYEQRDEKFMIKVFHNHSTDCDEIIENMLNGENEFYQLNGGMLEVKQEVLDLLSFE